MKILNFLPMISLTLPNCPASNKAATESEKMDIEIEVF